MVKINFDAKRHILNNKLQVVTINKDTQLSSLNLGVKVGALYESQDEKGVAHFIEHMLFKGTKLRSNEQLNCELENLGGEYNAYTDYTSTVYSITCLQEEIENALELLSDMIINPVFESKEMRKERGVILSEIRTSKDDIEDLSFRRTSDFAFKNSGLKYDIMGTEDSVASFKKEDLRSFYNKYYSPTNTILTFVSSYSHEEAIKIVKKYFGLWENKSVVSTSFVFEKNNHGVFESYKTDMEQTTITYLFAFEEIPKEMELPLRILNHKLGESSNSLLFRELRENRGLSYDVYTHLDVSKYVKTLHIFTSVDEDSVKEVMDVIDKCIDDIKHKKIIFDDSTFSLMKKVHKTAVVSTLEDPTDLGNYCLHQLLEDEDIYEFIEDMEELDKLKPEDIYEVSQFLLNDPTIHILKSCEREEKLE
ncbi:MAG: pitrilysin family protein [Clostridiaceae bacterium]